MAALSVSKEKAMTPFPRIAAIAARMEALPDVAAAHPDRVKPGA